MCSKYSLKLDYGILKISLYWERSRYYHKWTLFLWDANIIMREAIVNTCGSDWFYKSIRQRRPVEEVSFASWRGSWQNAGSELKRSLGCDRVVSSYCIRA